MEKEGGIFCGCRLFFVGMSFFACVVPAGLPLFPLPG